MKYLKVWTSFRDVIEPLSDDEKGRLFVMMLLYAESFVEPNDFKGNERFVWPAAKQWIDLTYSENLKQRENGKKGGRPKTENNQEKPNKTQIKPNDPNESLNVMKNNVNKNNDNSKKRFVPPTLQEVTEYCQSRNNGVDPQRFIDFYASKGWMVGKNAMKDWKACVRTWEGRDKGQKKVIAQEFQQRDYSDVNDQMMNELAREMEAFKKEVG